MYGGRPWQGSLCLKYELPDAARVYRETGMLSGTLKNVQFEKEFVYETNKT